MTQSAVVNVHEARDKSHFGKSSSRESHIIESLIGAMQELIRTDDTFSPELFTDYANCYKQKCHKLVSKLIREAARSLPKVEPLPYEKQLGTDPKWRPDVILQDTDDQYLAIVEYESLNSSDYRVVSKDVNGYQSWIENAPTDSPVPLLVITTLQNMKADYRLRHKGSAGGGEYGAYNIDHAKNEPVIQSNPFLYWYAFYRRWLQHRIVNMPVFFANIDGNQLTHLESWPAEAMPYQPVLDDGSDWSGLYPAMNDIENVRMKYKRLLWEQTCLPEIQKIMGEYWEAEQKGWGANGWPDWAATHFQVGTRRTQNRDDACRWIEHVQWARIY